MEDLIMKRFVSAILAALMLFGIASCTHSALAPMNEIYIYFSGFGMTYPEYKIDLVDKKFWEFRYSGDYVDFIPRDKTAPNEGFTFVCALDDDKIRTFLKDAEAADFASWKEKNDNPSVMDGLQWGMTINYADGTQKLIWGSNAFPKSWEKMKPVFKALTGEEILIGSNEQYNH
jgi:hypothetical protein